MICVQRVFDGCRQRQQSKASRHQEVDLSRGGSREVSQGGPTTGLAHAACYAELRCVQEDYCLLYSYSTLLENDSCHHLEIVLKFYGKGTNSKNSNEGMQCRFDYPFRFR